MKKLLYITASTKPENMSVSKQAGREFVNRFISDNPDYTVEELDVYNEDIPEMNHVFLTGWVQLKSGADYDALNEQDKESVDKINSLCNQFLAADTYVIAAPMWSMSFPSRLKQYIDCILLNGKAINLTPQKAKGLLDDKIRKMVYIQSSGGKFPKIIDWKFNYGVNYFHDMFKSLGVKEFYKILIQGTDMVDIGKDKAWKDAAEDFEEVLEKICG
jgi:FMN-dependent NADH-azoreductase